MRGTRSPQQERRGGSDILWTQLKSARYHEETSGTRARDLPDFTLQLQWPKPPKLHPEDPVPPGVRQRSRSLRRPLPAPRPAARSGPTLP